MSNSTPVKQRGNRTVLVTGGAGFIGTEIVRHLRRAGRRVVVVDRLDERRQRHSAAELTALGADVIDDDLRGADPTALVRSVDGIVHLAGRPGVQPSWGAGFDRYLDDNVSVTAHLLHAVAEHAEATGFAPRVVLASATRCTAPCRTGSRPRVRRSLR